MLSKKRKKKLELTNQSFIDIAQELYNDLNEQASMCLEKITHNNLTHKPADIIEFTHVNKINNELLKIVDLSLQKKVLLLKLMSNVIHKSGDDGLIGNSDNLKPEDLSFIQEALNNIDDYEQD